MFRTLGLAALLLPVLAAPALADTKAQIVHNAEVYTSPGRYPILGRLARGEAVKLAECTKDRAWCQIGSGALNGWVLASTVEAAKKR